VTGPPPSRFAVVAAETEAAKQAQLHDRYLCGERRNDLLGD
jgi:hypothetical protein